MKTRTALLALGLSQGLGGLAFGQTAVIGDAWILGELGAGTTAPASRIEVLPSSATEIPFQVSGVDETPFLVVGKDGTVGLSTRSTAGLDVSGVADSGDIGLSLRSGNLAPNTGSRQLLFGFSGSTDRRHMIRTVHSSAAVSNSMDFFVWSTAVSASDPPTLQVVSLVAISTGASAHIRPVGTPDVELEVSDGSTTGGGTVHRAAEATHSSRELKTDIRYLGQEEELKAYEELKSLKHAQFRYMKWTKKGLKKDGRQPLRRGLIYEETPESVRGPGESVVIDERVNNTELALKELIRRLEGAEVQASKINP